jgi:deoxyinosine 3'endonuclease (endonuclease V)
MVDPAACCLIDLPGAQRIVLACSTRYRLPEPTRLADQLVGAAKRAMG